MSNENNKIEEKKIDTKNYVLPIICVLEDREIVNEVVTNGYTHLFFIR